MGRQTYRLSDAMIDEIKAEAKRRGVTEVHYVRDAISRQLGRDGCRDDIAELRALSDERFAALEASVAAIRNRVDRIARRVGG